MYTGFRRLLVTAAWVGAALTAPVAQATVIDFEGDAVAGLHGAGDPFFQNGYKLTAGFDFGIVNYASEMDDNSAPIGNATQVYFNTNDGELIVERTNGGLFDLNGFSAAFVPLDPPSSQQTVIAAVGTFADGTTTGIAFLFSPAVNGKNPFATYSNPANFSSFVGLKTLEFFSCSYDGTNVCAAPTQNNGQFAIDDIRLTNAVPEPGTLALMAAGLLGLALQARRRVR